MGLTEKQIIEQRLLCPFTADDIDIRAGAGAGGGKNVPLFYVTTRAVDKRLRQVFGLGGYRVKNVNHSIVNETIKKKIYVKQGETLKPVLTDQTLVENGDNKTTTKVFDARPYEINSGLLVATACEIHVHTELMQFVVSNVGEKGLDETGFNKVTSSYAQAYKRAASNMGVGSYLYYLKNIPGVKFENNKCALEASDEPVRTTIQEALGEVGFLFICEETGNRIDDWTTCARSMEKCGRVLSVEGYKKLRDEGKI